MKKEESVTSYVEKRIVLLIIIIVIAVFALFFAQSAFGANYLDIHTDEKNVRVYVEVADAPAEWQKGLMFRSSLGENDGMLFVFNDDQRRVFWMKDTLIPLDIIFVSSDLEIVDIKEDLQPCEETPCLTYESAQAARYAIEVNAGYALRNGLEIGNTIRLNVD